LQKRRQEFLKNSKRQAKNSYRENETISKLAQFSKKIKDSGDEGWLNHKIKFDIDSVRAYEVNDKSQQKIEEDLHGSSTNFDLLRE